MTTEENPTVDIDALAAEVETASASAKEATDSHKAWKKALADAKKAAKGAEDAAAAQKAVDDATAGLNAAKESMDGWKARVKELKASLSAAKKKTKAPAKPKEERLRQNDVIHPKPGSLCGQAWEIFDRLTAAAGSPTPCGPAVEEGERLGLKPGNVRAEYSRWRKFHGHPPVGRAKKPEAAPAAPPAPAPAPAPADG